jgi:hypothetical protein
MITRSQSKNAKRRNEEIIEKPKRRKIVEEPDHNQDLHETQIEYYKHLNLQHELQNQKRNLELKLAQVNKNLRKNHSELQQFERDIEVLQHVLIPSDQQQQQHQTIADDTDDTYSASSSSSSSDEESCSSSSSSEQE